MEPAFYRGDLLFLTAATLDQGRQPRNWRVALPRARMAQRVSVTYIYIPHLADVRMIGSFPSR